MNDRATLFQVHLSGHEIRLIAEALNHRAQGHESNCSQYGMWNHEVEPLKNAAKDCRDLSAKLMEFV